MKHLSKKKELGRTKDQRNALIKTMLSSLIMKEKISTTETKAKVLKDKIDKIINKVKKNQADSKKLAVRRNLKKNISEMAIKKIMGDFLKKFESRNSGYTRVIKLAPRKSDNAKIAIIEFV